MTGYKSIKYIKIYLNMTKYKIKNVIYFLIINCNINNMYT